MQQIVGSVILSLVAAAVGGADSNPHVTDKGDAPSERVLSQSFGGAFQKFMPGASSSSPPEGDDVQRCWNIRLHAVLPGQEKVQLPVPLMTAAMIQSEPDLQVWRACQLSEVRDQVPKSYQQVAVDRVRQQFQRRVDELQSSSKGKVPSHGGGQQLPVLLTVADKLETEQELRAWRAHQLALVNNVHVSPRERRFAMQSLETTFQQRLAHVKAQPQNKTGVQKMLSSAELALERIGMAAEAPDENRPDSVILLILLVLGGLSLPAMMSLGGSACSMARRRKQLRAGASESIVDSDVSLRPMQRGVEHGNCDAYIQLE